MKSAAKINLDLQDLLRHFSPAILFMGLALLSAYWWSVVGNNGLLQILLLALFAVSASFVYYVQNRALYYEECIVDLSEQDFQSALSFTANKLHWQRLEQSDRYVVMIRPSNVQEEGELINLLITNNRLYVNSISIPQFGFIIGSARRNHENVLTFVNAVLKISQGEIPERPKTFKPKTNEQNNPWNLKQIGKRMVGYGLTLLFVFLALIMVREESVVGIFLLMWPVTIGCLFIYDDYRSILGNK